MPAPRSLLSRAVKTFVSPSPDMGLRLASKTFQARLGMLLERYRYDVVQIEGIEMAPYGLWLVQHPLWRNAQQKEDLPTIPIGRPRLVFDDHNAEYVLQQRAWETDRLKPARWHAAAYSLVQWDKLRRYERQICQQADRVIAVSEADREALLRLDPKLWTSPSSPTASTWTTTRPTTGRATPGARLRPQRAGLHRQDGLPAQRGRRDLVRP